MGPSSHESYFTLEAELPVSCCRGDSQIVSYPNRGVVVVEKSDEESDQCYEDYHCWISSGEKSPKVSPIALNPLTPHPIHASLEGHKCGHGRKVSFYNDVTVYVFDQESPTRELRCLWPDDCSKETNSRSLMTICRDNPNITGQRPPPPGNHLGHPPQLSTSGASSEDIGVSLEWEDDFSVLGSSLKTTTAEHQLIIPESSAQSVPTCRSSAPPHWRGSSPFTRACSQLRPSSLVLTHVTDTDLEH